MIKKLLFAAALTAVAGGAQAQRQTDKLDRGVIAMKVSGGVYVNWRIPAEEYYDVTYNVYRNGVKLNDKPLLTPILFLPLSKVRNRHNASLLRYGHQAIRRLNSSTTVSRVHWFLTMLAVPTSMAMASSIC